MTHALIIGGGIAGATAAMSLGKAGISATVHEAYPAAADDDAGAFLVLFPNGLQALRTIDAHEPVLEASFSAERVEMLAHTGDSLGVRPIAGGLPAGTPEEETPGPRTIRRAVLCRVLRQEAERRGAAIEYGKRLVDAVTGEDGRVTARFADGSTAQGDLLIGADGLHSVTRRLIDPAAPGPRHTGQITVCGRTPGAGPEIAPAPGTYRMIRGRRAFLGCTLAPGGDLWWFANTPGGELSRSALATATPRQHTRWRDHVAGLFSEDASPAAEIVRGSGAGIVATNAYDLARTPVWSRGPLVVLGDAAHAATPNAAQGASMAIEDSVVLAKCLRDLPGPEAAFARFELLRRGRVEAVVERSARLNDRAVQRPAAHRTAPHPGQEAPAGSDWLLRYRIDWDSPVGAGTAGTP